MPSTSTLRRASTTSDGSMILISNQPQVQTALASTKAGMVPALGGQSLTPRHIDASSMSSSVTKSPAPSNNATAAAKKGMHTAASARRDSANAAGIAAGALTPARRSSSNSSNTTRTSEKASAQLISTPRAACTANGSTVASASGSRKLRMTTTASGRASECPRFAQQTLSSRAHMPSSDIKRSLDGAAPRVVPSASTTASVEPGRPRRLSSARGGNAVGGIENTSLRSPPLGSGIQRVAVSPMELETAQTKVSLSSVGIAGGKTGEVAGDDRSSNTSVGEGTKVPRFCMKMGASAAAPTGTDSASSSTTAASGNARPAVVAHRLADPAPNIGVIRRRPNIMADIARDEMRDFSESLHSTQQPRSVVTTPASTPVRTPSEARSTSVAQFPLPLPADLDETTPKRSAPCSSYSVPRPLAMVSSGWRARSTTGQHDARNIVTGEKPSADATSEISTPLRSPKAGGAAAEMNPAMRSPPSPVRPTAALRERSPIVYQNSTTGTTASRNTSAPCTPPSRSASMTSVRAAQRSDSESAGHRNSSPRLPPTKMTSEARRARDRSVSPLSADDLRSVGAVGVTAAQHRASPSGTPRSTACEVKRRSPSWPTADIASSLFVTTSLESVHANITMDMSAGRSSHRFASILETDADVDAAGQSVPAHFAPIPTVHRSSSSMSNRGVRPPALENIAALLEDLQVLRLREEEEARRNSEDAEAVAEAEAAAERSHQRVVAAVKVREASSFNCSGAAADDDDDAEQRSVFPLFAEVDVNDSEVGSTQDLPSRATDTTGYAPITPRLRRRIEQEQQRELEMLRTITKERHPENVKLLDSPNTLIRGLGCIDPDMDPVEAEEALSSRNSEREDEGSENLEREEESPPVLETADEPTPPPRRKGPAAAKPTKVLPCGGGDARPAATGKPPLCGDVPTTPSGQWRRKTQSDVTPPSAKAAAKTSETGRLQRLGSATRGEAISTRKSDLNSSLPSSLSPAASQANTRPPSSRGCQTSAAENSNKNNTIDHRSGTRFARYSSKVSVNREVPSAVSENAHLTREALRASVAADEGAARRRRTLTEGTVNGGAGPSNCNGAPSPSTEQSMRTALRRGSVPSHPGEATTPQCDKATATELLLPALISPEEAANTITIVFDLDETLCNNRCLSGTVLRPGASLLLHTLRSLAPSPRYKFIDNRTRGQHATNRLYDQAMLKMGMTPLYRPRVAQRQANGGYHNNVVGGSTGEARPATGKEINPLRIELVLWTASEENLARRAMRLLDPHNFIFDEAIYRDLRWYRDSYYTKSLSRLGRPMNRVVIIENSVESVVHNRQNAILVTSFITNRLDRQLFLVREVLRDWIRCMKENLAYMLEHPAPVPHGDETCAAAHGSAVLHGGDGHDCASEESHEEGGESRVPHRSAASASRTQGPVSATEALNGAARADSYGRSHHSSNDNSRRSPTSSEERASQSTASASASKMASSSLTLSTSGLNTSSNSTGSAPRTLRVAAQRAANVRQFLHHHRLILAESNYINFQMTGEVMMRLQSTETALITAALPPPSESPAARAMRSAPCGPASRPLQAPRAPPADPSPSGLSTSLTGAPRTSAATVSATQGGHTVGSGGTSAGAVRGPASPHSGAHTSSMRTGLLSRSDAPNEVRRGLNPVSPSADACNSSAMPNAAGKASAVYTDRVSRPASAAMDAQISTSSAGAGADAAAAASRVGGTDRSAWRPQRSTSVTAKRQVT
ncbi:hypothetical protein ABL78_6470 [Leptomonas seymouri]|uniref:FCP1 homology domain-containing protein n=1 Tax=Leptomonas seymouri TaxID=5684 RepID=A0A0N1II69_LEPSE|nr:hypothetical protein ABL78_6470 [Leptomonas seymouri]|eukprot:KPI84482.1 hypothetical protein ABL78_6470 [Leptomonas seymouri]